jgi:uncharacterized membrane protein
MLGPRGLKPLIEGGVLLLAAVFVFRTLVSIDLTSLWNDELRTVEKSFQPSLGFLVDYLRADVHPPLYYGMLWLFGQMFGQTLLVLRGFSWLSYLLAAGALTLAVWQWRPSIVAAASAGLLVVALPFSVRFAVEGKAYSFMVALVALALWQRQRLIRSQVGADLFYPLAFAAAALTHYYGLGLLLAQALLDGTRRDWRLLRVDCCALLIPCLWMLSTIKFLLGDGGRQWIPPASPDLLRRFVLLAFGVHWPVVLALAGVLVLVLAVANCDRPQSPLFPLVRAWGLDAAALLAVLSFLVSIWRPSAVDRYYIVLLPACIGVFSCWLGEQLLLGDLLRWRGLLVVLCFATVLSLWWSDSFSQIAPSPGHPYRKGQDFRAVSIQASVTAGSGPVLKLSRQCRQLNASDHILVEGGIIPTSRSRWLCLGKGEPLVHRLQELDPLTSARVLVWASLGRQKDSDGVPAPADVHALESAGWSCGRIERLGPSTMLMRCRR